MLELTGDGVGLGCSPGVAVEDDAGVFLAMCSGGDEAEDFAVGFVAVVVGEDFRVDMGAVLVAEMEGESDFAVDGAGALDEAAGEAYYDELGWGFQGGCDCCGGEYGWWGELGLLGCENGGQEEQRDEGDEASVGCGLACDKVHRSPVSNRRAYGERYSKGDAGRNATVRETGIFDLRGRVGSCRCLLRSGRCGGTLCEGGEAGGGEGVGVVLLDRRRSSARGCRSARSKLSPELRQVTRQRSLHGVLGRGW